MNTVASAAEIVAALCSDRPSLAELRKLFPEAWQIVYAELSALARQQDPARVAEDLTLVHQEWLTLQPDCHALREKYSQVLAEKCGQCLMRKIALEQYCRALQQQTLKTAGLSGLRDRLLVRLLILPLATARQALPFRLHRMAWRLLRNPGAAAAMLMQAGCYLIAPAELIESLRTRIGSRQVLEIGAGRGTLALLLGRAGVDVTAVDDFSWAGTVPMGKEVLQMEGREELARFKPQVVVCCWPPPGNTFEQEIFLPPEVQEYIVIISRHRHASGNHQAYARAKGFRCIQATGLLAGLLLPSEAESVLYIFTRVDQKGQSGLP